MTYEQPLHAFVGDRTFDLIVILYRNVKYSCKLQGIYSTMEKVGYEWARSLLVLLLFTTQVRIAAVFQI